MHAVGLCFNLGREGGVAGDGALRQMDDLRPSGEAGAIGAAARGAFGRRRVELIHMAFLAQAAAAPSALAVSSDVGELTYGQLERLSAALALELSRDGARDTVAILAERGPRLVVAVLGCLRAGRAFVVLDLAYPADRLRTLVDICRPGRVLLAGRHDGQVLAGSGLPVSPVPLTPWGPAVDAPAVAISPDDPAYLLFTSGSTGAPKCVACSHRPLMNFVAWQARTFGLGAGDRFTLLSGLSHDPILRDLFTPLSLGASIHIPSQATLTAPGALFAWFRRTRPTVAHMTPPLGRLLMAGRGAAEWLDDLRYVFWGGDMLPHATVEALAAVAPNSESVNFYGSTETPQAAAFYRIPEDADARIPIGVGVDGFTLGLQDENGWPPEDGELGEIVVVSPFLTLGYVRDGVLHPPASPREYATGDLGYRRPDGQIVIQGRRDDQVKVRGYRVELAEITATLLQAPGARQAVTLNVGSPDQVRLCAFVEAGLGATPERLRGHVSRRLPAYMVPDDIVILPALPLLANGKIDRQALILGRRARMDAVSQPTAALTATEARLTDAWRGLFPEQALDASSSFGALGGDSLSYVHAYLAVEEVLGAVPDDWTTLTIGELAAVADPVAKPGPFIQIETAILLRAVAIAAVVASHFELFFTGGGAAGALLWVSGSIFGRLQLREADHQASLKPLGRLLASILLPLYVLEAPQFLVKVLTHHQPRLSSLLLTTDLLDYTKWPALGANAYGGHEFMMWYIHCVIHIVIAYALLLVACRYLFKLEKPALWAALAAAGLGLLGHFGLPALFQPDFWRTPVNSLSYFNHAPTTHLATFALGALSTFLTGRWRIAVLGVTLAYAGLSVPIYGAGDALPVALAAVLLFALPKLSLPRLLSRPLYLVAGASFFIYLLQFKFLLLINQLLHLPVIVAFIGALAGGVAAWALWNRGVKLAMGVLSRWQGWRSAKAWLSSLRGASARPSMAAGPFMTRSA